MAKNWRAAKLSQHSCLLEGLLFALNMVEGNFSIIIHANSECINVYKRNINSAGSGRFYCTNLSENDLITGSASERLAECIQLVASEKKPEVIYVFGSCVSEIIGDDLDRIVESAAKNTSIPVISVLSSGLEDYTQREVINRMAYLLCKACRKTEETKLNSVNLIGFPKDDGEIKRILNSAGIEINAWVDNASPLSEWKKLPAGALNVVPEIKMFSRLLEEMKAAVSTPYMETPIPYGLQNTQNFFINIASHFGLKNEMKSQIKELVESAKSETSSIIKNFKGKKIGYVIGYNRNYNPRDVINDGMAEAPVFMEFGFSITMLVQGSPDLKRQLLIQKQFKEMKLKADYSIFVDNVSLVPTVKKGKYDILYCDGFIKNESMELDLPVFTRESMTTGFEGFVKNALEIKRLMNI